MRKIFYLASCNTCIKVLKELNAPENIELHEIKSSPIDHLDVEEMKRLSGSYEALFSRRAIRYRTLGLKEKSLSEEEYKKYILSEYTFLKRPVIVIDNEIFIGHAKKAVDAAKTKIDAIR